MCLHVHTNITHVSIHLGTYIDTSIQLFQSATHQAGHVVLREVGEVKLLLDGHGELHQVCCGLCGYEMSEKGSSGLWRMGVYVGVYGHVVVR